MANSMENTSQEDSMHLNGTDTCTPVWDISRYGSLRVIKVAAQINQNWYVYQKYRYAGPARRTERAPYRTWLIAHTAGVGSAGSD